MLIRVIISERMFDVNCYFSSDLSIIVHNIPIFAVHIHLIMLSYIREVMSCPMNFLQSHKLLSI